MEAVKSPRYQDTGGPAIQVTLSNNAPMHRLALEETRAILPDHAQLVTKGSFVLSASLALLIAITLTCALLALLRR